MVHGTSKKNAASALTVCAHLVFVHLYDEVDRPPLGGSYRFCSHVGWHHVVSHICCRARRYPSTVIRVFAPVAKHFLDPLRLSPFGRRKKSTIMLLRKITARTQRTPRKAPPDFNKSLCVLVMKGLFKRVFRTFRGALAVHLLADLGFFRNLLVHPPPNHFSIAKSNLVSKRSYGATRHRTYSESSAGRLLGL